MPVSAEALCLLRRKPLRHLRTTMRLFLLWVWNFCKICRAGRACSRRHPSIWSHMLKVQQKYSDPKFNRVSTISLVKVVAPADVFECVPNLKPETLYLDRSCCRERWCRSWDPPERNSQSGPVRTDSFFYNINFIACCIITIYLKKNRFISS